MIGRDQKALGLKEFSEQHSKVEVGFDISGNNQPLVAYAALLEHGFPGSKFFWDVCRLRSSIRPGWQTSSSAWFQDNISLWSRKLSKAGLDAAYSLRRSCRSGRKLKSELRWHDVSLRSFDHHALSTHAFLFLLPQLCAGHHLKDEQDSAPWSSLRRGVLTRLTEAAGDIPLLDDADVELDCLGLVGANEVLARVQDGCLHIPPRAGGSGLWVRIFGLVAKALGLPFRGVDG